MSCIKWRLEAVSSGKSACALPMWFQVLKPGCLEVVKVKEGPSAFIGHENFLPWKYVTIVAEGESIKTQRLIGFDLPKLGWLADKLVLNRLAAYLRQPHLVTESEAADFGQLVRSSDLWDKDEMFVVNEYLSGRDCVTTTEDIRFTANVVVDESIEVDGTFYRYMRGSKPTLSKWDGFVINGDGAVVLKGLMITAGKAHLKKMGLDVSGLNTGDIVTGPDTIKRFGAYKGKSLIESVRFFEVAGQNTEPRDKVSISRQLVVNYPEGEARSALMSAAMGNVSSVDLTKVRVPGVAQKTPGIPWKGIHNLMGHFKGAVVCMPEKMIRGNSVIVWRYPYDGGIVVAQVVPWDYDFVAAYGIDSALGGDYDGDEYYYLFTNSVEPQVVRPDIAHTTEDNLEWEEAIPVLEAWKGRDSSDEFGSDLDSSTVSKAVKYRYYVELVRTIGGNIGGIMNTALDASVCRAVKEKTTWNGMSPADWSVVHGAIHAQKKPITKGFVDGLSALIAFKEWHKNLDESTHYSKLVSLLMAQVRGQSKIGHEVFNYTWSDWDRVLEIQYTKMAKEMDITFVSNKDRGLLRLIEAFAIYALDLWKLGLKGTPYSRMFNMLVGTSPKGHDVRKVVYAEWTQKLLLASTIADYSAKVANIDWLLHDATADELIYVMSLVAFGDVLAYMAPRRAGLGILYSIYNHENNIKTYFESRNLTPLFKAVLTGKGVTAKWTEDGEDVAFTLLSEKVEVKKMNIFAVNDRLKSYSNKTVVSMPKAIKRLVAYGLKKYVDKDEILAALKRPLISTA